MIKVYKSEKWDTEQSIIDAISEAKIEIEEHTKTIGVPAPSISDEVKALMENEWEFIPMTAKEEFEQKRQDAVDKYEAEKLAAQADPSERYAEFRSSEFPPLPDQLDYIFHNGVDAWKTDVVQPIKDKYPKPEA